MPRKSYTGKLSRAEVLDLLNSGRYIIDIDLGEIYKRNKEPLYTFTNSQSDHRWVRLFKHPKYKCIPVSHAVWMFASQTIIPEGWEVHHIDTDPANDSFKNLMCLYPTDHRKLHQALKLEEAPF